MPEEADVSPASSGIDQWEHFVKYVSTRGEAPVLDFEDVLLAGLARDGGLYLPLTWPRFATDEIRAMAGQPYDHVAFEVISRFTGDTFSEAELREMLSQAYATFNHPAVTPLRQLGADTWLLELFHGPTLAFKDVAMQILSRMMDHVLARRERRVTIVGATSGDTGGAAIEAFKGRDAIDVFILHPHGRVSDVQRRQMTCVDDSNVHNIALEGTFDDCQATVKTLFNNLAFRDKFHLAGVNSINWARIVAQIVYYFTSATALGAPDRPVNFAVPTGNFGDVFAGYAAQRMGLPVNRFVVATNVNDILQRTISTGRCDVGTVVPTTSPSMDIQVSSNFERLLFEVCDRDAETIRSLMNSLTQSGGFTVSADALNAMKQLFAAERTDEDQCRAQMRKSLQETGELIDPHTAVGLAAAERFAESDGPMICLATAHPAKFPDAVKAATTVSPELPERLAGLMEMPERFSVLANDTSAVEDFIASHARLGSHVE